MTIGDAVKHNRLLLGSWVLIPVRPYNCGCGKDIICRRVLDNPWP